MSLEIITSMCIVVMMGAVVVFLMSKVILVDFKPNEEGGDDSNQWFVDIPLKQQTIKGNIGIPKKSMQEVYDQLPELNIGIGQ